MCEMVEQLGPRAGSPREGSLPVADGVVDKDDPTSVDAITLVLYQSLHGAEHDTDRKLVERRALVREAWRGGEDRDGNNRAAERLRLRVAEIST